MKFHISAQTQKSSLVLYFTYILSWLAIVNGSVELKYDIVINLLTNNNYHQIVSIFTILETQTADETENYLLYCHDLLSPDSVYKDDFFHRKPSGFILLKDLKCEIEHIYIPSELERSSINETMGVTKYMVADSVNKNNEQVKLVSVNKETIRDTFNEFSYCDTSKIAKTIQAQQSIMFQLKVCISDEVFYQRPTKNNLPSDQCDKTDSIYTYENIFRKGFYLIAPTETKSADHKSLHNGIVEMSNILLNNKYFNKLTAYGINTHNRKPKVIARDKILYILLCILGVLFLSSVGIGIYFFIEAKNRRKDSLIVEEIMNLNEEKKLKIKFRKIENQNILNKLQIKSMFEDIEASKKLIDFITYSKVNN